MRVADFGAEAIVHGRRFMTAGLTQTGAVQLSADPILRYTLRPSYNGYLKGRRFTTNERGLRGRYFTQLPAPGVTRIAVIGGSVALGAGVGDNEAFPARIQQRLDQLVPDQTEVLNCAVGGYGYEQVFRLYDVVVASFRPDIIMLPVYPGALNLPFHRQREEAPGTSWQRLKRRLDIKRALSNTSFLYLALRARSKEWLRDHGSNWGLRIAHLMAAGTAATSTTTNRDAIEQFIRARRDDGIPVVMVSLLLPPGRSDAHTRQAQEELAHWTSLLPGAYLIDIRRELQGQITAASRIYPGDNHPNVETHSLYATYIVEKLRPILAKIWALKR